MLRSLAKALRRSSPDRARTAAAFESLENRQMLAVSPVVAGSKIKGVNLSLNNISTNSTLITIPFTGDITLVDVSKIRIFAYATNPMSSTLGQVKKTINVVD